MVYNKENSVFISVLYIEFLKLLEFPEIRAIEMLFVIYNWSCFNEETFRKPLGNLRMGLLVSGTNHNQRTGTFISPLRPPGRGAGD